MAKINKLIILFPVIFILIIQSCFGGDLEFINNTDYSVYIRHISLSNPTACRTDNADLDEVSQSKPLVGRGNSIKASWAYWGVGEEQGQYIKIIFGIYDKESNQWWEYEWDGNNRIWMPITSSAASLDTLAQVEINLGETKFETTKFICGLRAFGEWFIEKSDSPTTTRKYYYHPSVIITVNPLAQAEIN